jgi:hypothetical protein
MAEYERLVSEDDPLARCALEPVARLDAERQAQEQRIADADAHLGEWTAKVSADGVLDFYARIRDLVKGRVAQAEGIAEINAALHDSLMGVWMSYDGDALSAGIKVRPSGVPAYDAAVAELFGTLPSWQEDIEMLKQILPNEDFGVRQLDDREGKSR